MWYRLGSHAFTLHPVQLWIILVANTGSPGAQDAKGQHQSFEKVNDKEMKEVSRFPKKTIRLSVTVTVSKIIDNGWW